MLLPWGLGFPKRESWGVGWANKLPYLGLPNNPWESLVFLNKLEAFEKPNEFDLVSLLFVEKEALNGLLFWLGVNALFYVAPWEKSELIFGLVYDGVWEFGALKREFGFFMPAKVRVSFGWGSFLGVIS